MDAQKFGAFIAENRKQNAMTQADLAQRIHVTDKAVSRWERGKGFPDIHTIEPLANALGLSVLEIMRAEKTENSHNTDIAEALQTAVWLDRENRKQEQTALGIAVFTTIVVAVLFYLAGFGNLGGSIAFGAIVSVAETAVYYYLENREDAESRTINAIIGTIAVILIGILLIISIR